MGKGRRNEKRKSRKDIEKAREGEGGGAEERAERKKKSRKGNRPR